MIYRRNFLSIASAAIASSAFFPQRSNAKEENTSVRPALGLDGHSLRGMKWKARRLIEFAAQQRLDAVLMNNLNYFESLDDDYLHDLKEYAQSRGLRIYIGAGGICSNAAKFSNKYGDAEALLATGIRVATAVGSPIVNVRIGSIADRYLEGGIQPRIDEAIRILRIASGRAKDAGIKFGFENHAADLRSEELLALIQEVGTDVCGVMLDPGNALWAMEDPMVHLKALAPYVVCNSLRDYMVWQSPEGATFQWTAIGDGLMDVPTYVGTLAKSNPEMPLFVESISNSARPIPFLTDEHWKGYPDLDATGILEFLKLVRRGHEIGIDEPAAGVERKAFDQEHQRNEFLKSIDFLRKHCDAGQKT